MKWLFLAVCLLFLASFFPKPAYAAAQEFSTQYAVSVVVNTAGTSHVAQQITIKNLQPGTYAKEYSVTVSATNLQNVAATGPNGSMPVTNTVADNKTTLTVPFTAKVIGIGKTFTFTLAYDVNGFVVSDNTVKTITIPRFALSDDVTDYSLSVSLPSSFGTPTTLTPKPDTVTQSGNTTTWQYTKQTIADQSVYAIFGTAQYYAFSLSQTLTNPNLVAINKDITLVPQTAYQTVELDTITPSPKSVYADSDGNWLATFTIPRGKQETVLITGKIKLTAQAVRHAKIDSQTQRSLLQPQLYWEADDPAILNVINEIIKPSPNAPAQTALETARAIFQYEVTALPAATVAVDQSQKNRLGATKTLAHPLQASAYEFADTFVALARAANIPAREVFGVLMQPPTNQSQNEQYITHVWPEFYTAGNGWQAVDPLLENTSNGVDYFANWDVRHVGLAIWGADSESPYPDYIGNSLAEAQQHFVLTPAAAFADPHPDLHVDVRMTSGTIAGFPGRGEVVLTNTGKGAVDTTLLAISAKNFQLFGTTRFTTPVLPPMSSYTIPFTFRSKSFFSLSESTIHVAINGTSYTVPFVVKPLGNAANLLLLVPVLAGLTIGTLVFFIFRRKRIRPQAKKRHV